MQKSPTSHSPVGHLSHTMSEVVVSADLLPHRAVIRGSTARHVPEHRPVQKAEGGRRVPSGPAAARQTPLAL